MRLRPAATGDEELILHWANDPVARAAGFQTEPIPPEVHRRWFTRHLAEPESTRIWIGLQGRRPIGIVRVEVATDGLLVVSIALDPAERGQGRSRTLLEAGLAAARAAFPGVRFRAWIRRENEPSLALFRGAGFSVPSSRPAVLPRGAGPEAVVLERD